MQDIRADTSIEIIKACYPVLSDIQPYFTDVIRPDIHQFSILCQTKLTLSGRISVKPDIRPNPNLNLEIIKAIHRILYSLNRSFFKINQLI